MAVAEKFVKVVYDFFERFDLHCRFKVAVVERFGRYDNSFSDRVGHYLKFDDRFVGQGL